jgi:hypothetical protein
VNIRRFRGYGRAIKSRRVPGVMNKTEEAYSLILEAQKRNGGIHEYFYEKMTLKLANDCRFTPDFMVINREEEIEFHEVKGGLIREDAAIKLKVAASTFPFRFKLCQLKAKNWTIKEIVA